MTKCVRCGEDYVKGNACGASETDGRCVPEVPDTLESHSLRRGPRRLGLDQVGTPLTEASKARHFFERVEGPAGDVPRIGPRGPFEQLAQQLAVPPPGAGDAARAKEAFSTGAQLLAIAADLSDPVFMENVANLARSIVESGLQSVDNVIALDARDDEEPTEDEEPGPALKELMRGGAPAAEASG